MSVKLGPAWSGCCVSHLAAEVLARAQADAACHGDTAVGTGRVLAALLSTGTDEDSHARMALRFLDIDCDAGEKPQDILATGALAGATTPARVAPEDARLLRPDDDLRAVLATLDDLTRSTGDRCAGTLHLLAALADAPRPPAAWLRERHVGADRVLAAGARCLRPAAAGTEGDADDMAFVRPADPVPSDTFAVPPVPARTDLATRTPGRRSATMSRILTPMLPTGEGLNTPLGLRRTRRLSTAMLAAGLVAETTQLLILGAGVVHWALWALLILAVVAAPDITKLPTALWTILLAAVLVLSPLPIKLLAAAAAVGRLIELWLLLLIRRAEAADPAISVRGMRRNTYRQASLTGQQLIRRLPRV